MENCKSCFFYYFCSNHTEESCETYIPMYDCDTMIDAIIAFGSWSDELCYNDDLNSENYNKIMDKLKNVHPILGKPRRSICYPK